MQPKFYIIPGWEDYCEREPYQLLANMAREKGYEVVFKNLDWTKTFSSQFFPIEENAIVFGFSIGAVFARLLAQRYKCKLIILASMSLLKYFTEQALEKDIVDALNYDLVKDIKKNLLSEHKAEKQIIIYGDKENEAGDIIVPDTDHEITENYIEIVRGLI